MAVLVLEKILAISLWYFREYARFPVAFYEVDRQNTWRELGNSLLICACEGSLCAEGYFLHSELGPLKTASGQDIMDLSVNYMFIRRGKHCIWEG